jgi:hypothetical protein
MADEKFDFEETTPEELADFRQWKKDKNKPKPAFKVGKPEKMMVEIDPAELAEESEFEPEKETYRCPNCEYVANAPFDVCSQCKAKCTWD